MKLLVDLIRLANVKNFWWGLLYFKEALYINDCTDTMSYPPHDAESFDPVEKALI